MKYSLQFMQYYQCAFCFISSTKLDEIA